MATYSMSNSGANVGFPYQNPRLFEIETVFDASIPTPVGGWGIAGITNGVNGVSLTAKPTIPAGFTGGVVGATPNSHSNLAAADIVQLLAIPAGCAVHGIFWKILAADAGGGTISLGYTGAATTWLDGQAISSTTTGAVTATQTTGPVFFASASHLILTANTASITTLRLLVKAVLYRYDYPS